MNRQPEPVVFKAFVYRGSRRKLLGKFIADGRLYPPIIDSASRAIGAYDAHQPGIVRRALRKREDLT